MVTGWDDIAYRHSVQLDPKGGKPRKFKLSLVGGANRPPERVIVNIRKGLLQLEDQNGHLRGIVSYLEALQACGIQAARWKEGRTSEPSRMCQDPE